jgi:hypothetical protein
MRNSIIWVLCFTLLSTIFVSCKKGENDPGLSLRPRRERVIGKWYLHSGKVVYTPPKDPQEVSTYTDSQHTFEKAGARIVSAHDWTLSFDRAGTFNQIIKETAPGSITATETIKGNWAFMLKNKKQDFRNKEALYLTETFRGSSQGGALSTSEYKNPVTGGIWPIDQLKNTEMIIKFVTEEEKPDGFHVTDVYLVFRTLK